MFKSDVKKVYRKEQRDIRLEELQKLTNDELYIDEKTEFVKYKNIAVEMTKPKGTLLIRELIDSSELIRVIQDPNEGNEADDKYTNDGLNLLDYVKVNVNSINQEQYLSRDYFTGRLSEPICPMYIILGHELVHAYRRINNIPKNSIKGRYNTYREYDVTGIGYILYVEKDRIEELETTGITYTNTKTGEYMEASRFKYTENVLRKENKIGPRIRY